MKKDFRMEIPALDFLSKETISKVDGTPAPKKEAPAAKPKAKKKAEPTPAPAAGAEAKSRRVQLIFKPSIYNALRDYCESNDMSVNRYINRLIANDLIEKGFLQKGTNPNERN